MCDYDVTAGSRTGVPARDAAEFAPSEVWIRYEHLRAFRRQVMRFYQPLESPAMFARTPGAGSLYWLSARDSTGAYLDGARSYTLEVPQPVPAKLFWSLTVYDARTRSEIRAAQGKAALRSMFELADIQPDG